MVNSPTNQNPATTTKLKWQDRAERILLNQHHNIELIHPISKKKIQVKYTPSKLSKSSPLAQPKPDIRLVTPNKLIRHEGFLRQGLKKVSFMKNNIPSWDDAPLVGTLNDDGDVIILDGSTRLGRIDLLTYHLNKEYPEAPIPVFPVQLIDYFHPALILDIWKKHHPIEKKLDKHQVLEMAKSGNHVEPKQTKFGVNLDRKVYSIAETQGEVFIAIEDLLGFPLPDDPILHFLLT